MGLMEAEWRKSLIEKSLAPILQPLATCKARPHPNVGISLSAGWGSTFQWCWARKPVSNVFQAPAAVVDLDTFLFF
jgi:hypothetical protein